MFRTQIRTGVRPLEGQVATRPDRKGQQPPGKYAHTCGIHTFNGPVKDPGPGWFGEVPPWAAEFGGIVPIHPLMIA